MDCNTDSLAISPMALNGKNINATLEIPIDDIPAFLTAVAELYNMHKDDDSLPTITIQTTPTP